MLIRGNIFLTVMMCCFISLLGCEGAKRTVNNSHVNDVHPEPVIRGKDQKSLPSDNMGHRYIPGEVLIKFKDGNYFITHLEGEQPTKVGAKVVGDETIQLCR